MIITSRHITYLVIFLISILGCILFIDYNTENPLPKEIETPVDFKAKLLQPNKNENYLFEEPIQITNSREPIFIKNYTLYPKADFSIKAVVLSTKSYSWDKESDLSPVDFVLAWGKMSDPNIYTQLDISQRGRWFYWKTENMPIPQREIETSCANMHMIPSSQLIKDKLGRVSKKDKIYLEGYLVYITAEKYRWNSSLTRNDTGNGACEIIYVTKIDKLN